MKKDNDTIKVSSDSKLQLPLANLIGIIIVVFGYMTKSNLTVLLKQNGGTLKKN